MMSNTKNDPTNSSHIPRAGPTTPGPPQYAHDREEDEARQEPVLPPNPPLPQARLTIDRAKGAAKHAGPMGKPMTTGVLSRSRQDFYLPRQGSRNTCATGTSAQLLR